MGLDISTAMDLAASFPEVEVKPHFHKISYRTAGRIFLTIDENKSVAVVKLPPEDQVELIDKGEGFVERVKGKWGLQGWTSLDLENIENPLFELAVRTSYEMVRQKKK